ncbi:protein RarD [delta proteobacterium NaphS2]|nr:protein RarD [delta proteobacterium NaphS2]
MGQDQKTGFFLGVSAFTFWGLTPFYFKAISSVSPLEIVSHRIVWSTFILAGFLLIINRKFLKTALLQLKRHGLILGLAATLLAVNWLTYIYAVVNDRILEASLGYFINPLINVALAALILKEKLSRIQMIAVFLAAVGVSQEIFRFGQIPTLALIMAGTFGIYGLIRKKVDIGGSEGLLIETLLLMPFAAGYLFYLSSENRMAFLSQSPLISWLLLSAGLVTTLPLIWFIGATKRLNYSIVGLMQYIAPTLMGLLGYWIYSEGFPPGRLVTFTLVWSGLLLVVIETLINVRTRTY